MKVLYVYQDQYPWDVRVDKIVSTLSEENIGVHIVSRNRTNLPRTEQLGEHIRVHRLPRASWKPARDLANFPAFFSPIWLSEMTRLIRREGIDLLIARDLPLSPAAYIAAKATGRPVLMDMAENYPALIRSTWMYKGPKPVDLIFRNPTLLSVMERAIVPRMDGVLVVSGESAERVRRMRGPGRKVWIVGNTPMLGDEERVHEEWVIQWTKKIRNSASFVLLYVGFLEAHRGLDVAIKAVKLLSESMPGLVFIIIGTGTVEHRLRKLSKALNVEKHVVFTGWISNHELDPFIDVADVCLVPHYVTEHTHTTLPNKIFDYMKHGKPVVVTQSKSLSRIVKGADCGLVYQDDSPRDLRDKVEALRDIGKRQILGSNGLQAVRREFNWDYDRARLLKALREVL